MTILKHLGILLHKGILAQKGILYANGLLPPDVGFPNYYQWVFTGKSSEIITKDDLWYWKNFGIGGAAVDLQITDTQVLTIGTGVNLTFDNLTGIGIEEYRGESFYKNQQLIVNVVADTSITIINDKHTHVIKRVINAPLHLDYWSYYEFKNGELQLIQELSNIGVYQIAGSGTFTGEVHGYEETITNELLIDGVSIDIGVTATHYGNIAKYSDSANMLNTTTFANQRLRNKYIQIEYDNDAFEVYNKMTALVDISLDVDYQNMITPSLFYDKINVDNVDYDPTVARPTIIDTIVPVTYSTNNGNYLELTETILQTNAPTAKISFGTNPINYKLYWGHIFEGGAPVVYLTGEVAESLVSIRVYDIPVVPTNKYKIALNKVTKDRLIVERLSSEVLGKDYNIGFSFYVASAPTADGWIFSETDLSSAGFWVRLRTTGVLNVRLYTGGVSEEFNTSAITFGAWNKIEYNNDKLIVNDVLVNTFVNLGGDYTIDSLPMFNILNYGLPGYTGQIDIQYRDIIYRGERYYTNEGEGRYLYGERGSIIGIYQEATLSESKWVLDAAKPDPTYEGYYNRIGWTDDAVPRLNVNDIDFTAGLLSYLKLDDGTELWMQDATGVVIKDRLGLNDGTLIGANQAEAWGTKSALAKPALSIYGGEIYEDDAHPGDSDYYLYVIKGVDGFFNPTVSGYTNIGQFEPNKGFWNTGKVKQPSGDAGMFALTKAYPELDIFYGATKDDPLEVTHDQLMAIDLSGIPEADFRLTKSDDGKYIKDMASEPYEQSFDKDTDLPLYDKDTDLPIYQIKTF
jgi:hypothetical protein